jgi:hypothetical protein
MRSEAERMYSDVEKRLEREGWLDRDERAEQRAWELVPHWVEHEGVSNENVDSFKSLLRMATKEEELQKFLKEHPALLLNALIGYRGCVCIPKQKLGISHVTDFLVAWRDSMGFWWLGAELESPKAQMFNHLGDQSKELTHAINQIQKWRIWLTNQGSTARSPRDEGGHSLIDIDEQLPSFILIGRRREQKYDNPPLRRQICKDLKIAIHPYDWIPDQVRPPRRPERKTTKPDPDSIRW